MMTNKKYTNMNQANKTSLVKLKPVCKFSCKCTPLQNTLLPVFTSRSSKMVLNHANDEWATAGGYKSSLEIGNRPPQNFDVLAVLDFQISFHRPETPGFYPRCLLTKVEDHRRKLGRPRRLWGRERGVKDPGRRGRKLPEDPWSGMAIGWDKWYT